MLKVLKFISWFNFILTAIIGFLHELFSQLFIVLVHISWYLLQSFHLLRHYCYSVLILTEFSSKLSFFLKFSSVIFVLIFHSVHCLFSYLESFLDFRFIVSNWGFITFYFSFENVILLMKEVVTGPCLLEFLTQVSYSCLVLT